jgi:hypothetical protein
MEPAMVVADDPDLASNSVFAGRYRIVRRLGEGDRKRTYLADDLVVPRQVAVAVIKAAAARADPAGTRREAEALAKAGTHPNVVTFHDWGVAEDAEYLVFDYLAGGTLREYFTKHRQREKVLPFEDVMRLGRQLARALAHVHRLGLIHRDVAPGNIWLDKRLIAHLGDFDSAVSGNAALDPVGLPPTTEAYAAPEQVAGEPFDGRSDLYSLGAVLYEALTGEMPNHGPRAALAKRVKALRPDVPRSLSETVCSLLEFSPDDRPNNAEEVLEALTSSRAYRAAGEGLLVWTDTLPFPLASILWHYDGEPEPESKIGYLLKFFEGLAQFAATVLLSGCMADSDFFEANVSSWFGGEQRPLELQPASFGVWVTLTERLAVSIREMLGGDTGEDWCRELLAATDIELVEALADPDLGGILRHACDRRNNWTGHGGVVAQHIHQERVADLEDLLDRTRALLGWSFETWTLLKPGPMICSRGLFDLTATILKGPHPSFRKKHVQLAEALDAGRLYLLNDGNLRALQLVPFIRVLTGKSGQEACYFYSRLEGSQVRWVSYHFHAEPELILPDDDLTDVLAILAPRSSSGAQHAEAVPAMEISGLIKLRRPTVWSLLEECVGQLDQPFGRSEIVGWFRRHHPDVKESTLAAHIQAATSNATNRAVNNQLGKRPPLVMRIDRGRYIRAGG